MKAPQFGPGGPAPIAPDDPNTTACPGTGGAPGFLPARGAAAI